MAVYQQKIGAVFTVFTISEIERYIYIIFSYYFDIILYVRARVGLIFKNSEDSEDKHTLYIYILLYRNK